MQPCSHTHEQRMGSSGCPLPCPRLLPRLPRLQLRWRELQRRQQRWRQQHSRRPERQQCSLRCAPAAVASSRLNHGSTTPGAGAHEGVPPPSAAPPADQMAAQLEVAAALAANTLQMGRTMWLGAVIMHAVMTDEQRARVAARAFPVSLNDGKFAAALAHRVKFERDKFVPAWSVDLGAQQAAWVNMQHQY